VATPWPVTLQQKLNERGFAYAVGETVIRTEMDVGPVKVRRRSTRPIDKIKGSINLTTDEYDTLQYFFNTTLNGGTERFSFNHPITGVSTEFRFTGPISYSSIGGGNFVADMEWEVMV
jgi:hypothetical protein